MGLTLAEARRLIGLSLLAFVVMLVARFLLPSSPQPLLILGSVAFIVLIYRATPAGRGSIDFKVGLLVGCTLAILMYELLSQVLPLLFKALNL